MNNCVHQVQRNIKCKEVWRRETYNGNLVIITFEDFKKQECLHFYIFNSFMTEVPII